MWVGVQSWKKSVWMVWPIKRVNMGINLRKCCLLSRGWLGGATDQWLQLPRLWSRLPQVFPRRERENWQPGSAKRIYQQCQNHHGHPQSDFPALIWWTSPRFAEDLVKTQSHQTTEVRQDYREIARIRPSISAVAGQDDCPQRSIYAYRYRSR